MPVDAGSGSVMIVGAGPVGSLLACFLARRGFRPRVFERRPDMRREAIAAGRSINLALSVRGLHALREVGLEEAVLRLSVPMRGRMIHAVDGGLTFQPYGKDDSECIYSVSRGELNKLLLSHAETFPGVEITFNRRAVAADLDRGSVTFRDERSGETRAVESATIFGTDGSASVIRDAVVRGRGKFTEEALDHGYKELTLPAAPGGKHPMEKNALHIWPRGSFMLIALPNLDGSFTCTLFLPAKGDVSFEKLDSAPAVRSFFTTYFPDALALIPSLAEQFFEHPTGRMTTVRCSPWHAEGRALLLGDAAHAIVPFFGQGMNCGFEDCSVLDALLEGEPASVRPGFSFGEIFRTVSVARKADADAIAEMAIENFVEMRDKTGDPRFLLEKAVERKLQSAFPEEYVSRYRLVTFGREPYRFAYEVGAVQNEVLAELCRGLASAEAVDLKWAATLIRSRLAPLMNRKEEGMGHGS